MFYIILQLAFSNFACTKLEVSKDFHLVNLSTKGRLTLAVLVGGEGTTSLVNFETCRVQTTSPENQPICERLQTSQMQLIFSSYRTAFIPEKKFSSGNPQKILNHLRIPEYGPVRDQWMPPESRCFPRHGPLSQAPLKG